MTAHDHAGIVPGCARCELSVDEAIAAAIASPTPDRLAEIEARLAHENEPCCDHSGRDEHGCWHCRNTGHAHAPYADDEARADLAALLAVVKAVRDLRDRVEGSSFEALTRDSVVRSLEAALSKLEQP